MFRRENGKGYLEEEREGGGGIGVSGGDLNILESMMKGDWEVGDSLSGSWKAAG